MSSSRGARLGPVAAAGWPRQCLAGLGEQAAMAAKCARAPRIRRLGEDRSRARLSSRWASATGCSIAPSSPSASDRSASASLICSRTVSSSRVQPGQLLGRRLQLRVLLGQVRDPVDDRLAVDLGELAGLRQPGEHLAARRWRPSSGSWCPASVGRPRRAARRAPRPGRAGRRSSARWSSRARTVLRSSMRYRSSFSCRHAALDLPGLGDRPGAPGGTRPSSRRTRRPPGWPARAPARGRTGCP